jgi:hypothetical protein
LKPENVDTWPDPGLSRRNELPRVLDDYADEYFEHELVGRDGMDK